MLRDFARQHLLAAKRQQRNSQHLESSRSFWASCFPSLSLSLATKICSNEPAKRQEPFALIRPSAVLKRHRKRPGAPTTRACMRCEHISRQPVPPLLLQLRRPTTSWPAGRLAKYLLIVALQWRRLASAAVRRTSLLAAERAPPPRGGRGRVEQSSPPPPPQVKCRMSSMRPGS